MQEEKWRFSKKWEEFIASSIFQMTPSYGIVVAFFPGTDAEYGASCWKRKGGHHENAQIPRTDCLIYEHTMSAFGAWQVADEDANESSAWCLYLGRRTTSLLDIESAHGGATVEWSDSRSDKRLAARKTRDRLPLLRNWVEPISVRS